MKTFVAAASLVAFSFSAVAFAEPTPKPAPMPAPVAQEVVPIDPVTGIQGFGALGATTTLSIIAGVVTVGVLVAATEETTTTGTN